MCRTFHFPIQDSFNTNTNQLRVDAACDLFVSHLYGQKFSNHVPSPCPGSLDGVLGALQRSKLSEKTKAQLPSKLRVEATIRNANWVLQYWECRQPAPNITTDNHVEDVWDYTRCFPNPICETYGFRSSKKRKNAVQWLDVDDGDEI